jgi:2-methylcitrate dehydratase PrpD
LPALIAVAESHADLSGRDFLTAAVAGYEIGPRVGRCMGQEHIGQGWHSGATVGVYSAAAGAARGLGLSAEETVHALGIAGTQSAGLMAAQYGAMVKRMHAGRASQSGLYGALLARNGFTGIVDVFEAPYGGFCTTFSRSQDRFDLDQLSAGLGERFETMGIRSSSIPASAATIRRSTPFATFSAGARSRPAEVDKIVVHGSQVTVDHVGWPYRPQGLTSAQLNLPFCVATLLIEGDVFVDQFEPDAGHRSRAHRAVAQGRSGSRPRHYRAGLGLPAQGAGRGPIPRRLAEIETREAPRGSEQSFATEDEIIDKFRKLTGAAMMETQQAALIEAVLEMEQLSASKRLTDLLRCQ